MYFFFAAIFLVAICFINSVHWDEAYYTISAHEVTQSKLPYADFFFHQMPIMLYTYSFTTGLGYWSFIAGRLLSISFFILSAFLFYKFVIKKYFNQYSSIFLLFIFFIYYLVRWISLIKTYALLVLFLTCALVSLYLFFHAESKKKLILIFLSGFFNSCLVFTRIVCIVNLSLFTLLIFYLVIFKKENNKVGLFIAACAGIAIPILIMLGLFWNHLDSVYTNTLTYNRLVKNIVIESNIFNYMNVIRFFFIPQIFIIILLILFSGLKYNLFEIYLVLNIIFFTAIHLFSQMLTEYLIPIIPLLILLMILRFDNINIYLKKLFQKHPQFNVNKAIIIIYILTIPVGTHIVPIFTGTEKEINPIQLLNLTNKINNLQGITVLSSWEGYSIYSNKNALLTKSYISDNYKDVIKYMKSEDQKYFTNRIDFENIIKNKESDIIVFDKKSPFYLEGMESLITTNYYKVFSYREIDVYKKI